MLLLTWLVVFIVAARVAMTFFAIPWNAMFAEYSDDYRERSAIVSYRFLMAWIGGIVFSVSVYTWVFPGTPDHPLGQLNPDAYHGFAWVLAVSVSLTALMTAHFTRDQIPFLMQPAGSPERFRLGLLVQDVKMALRYSVTRERHAEVRRLLDARHANDPAQLNLPPMPFETAANLP